MRNRAYLQLERVGALLLLACPAVTPAQGIHTGTGAGPAIFDVRAFGARGDSLTIDTDAINRAIAAAHAAGGGTVTFSPGVYSSFCIHLASNVTLDLEQGATLFAASPAERATGGYDAAEPGPNEYQDYGHSHWHNS